MTLRFRTHLIWPSVAAAGVLALSACSGGDGSEDSSAPASSGAAAPAATASAGGELAIPDDADEKTKQEYLYENEMASCMRAKGFTYTPRVHRDDEDPVGDVDARNYATGKKYRAKYGFGIWAGAVYRDDPQVWGSEAYNAKEMDSPDSAYLNALSDAEMRAYNKAIGKEDRKGKHVVGGCLKQATEKVYGPEKSQSEIDKQAERDKQKALAAQQALNGDPQLVSLAQAYASCLTKEGITVTTTQPTSITDMVKFQVSSEIPENGVLSVAKPEAVTKLTQEIGLAGKDLECGKDFRAAYFPKLAKHPFQDLTG